MNQLLSLLNGAIYASVFFFLFVVDYAIGNGIVDMLQRLFCKVTCLIKKTIRQESKVPIGVERSFSLPVLLAEMLLLSLTIAVLNKYKNYRGKDRIDELLQESKEALRETNDFLEKWRLRRINWHKPSEYSYLDEEPQEITPLDLEVPILHMALVDTLGKSRSQAEQGDMEDTYEYNVTNLSFRDEPGTSEEVMEEQLDEHFDYNNRYLWDVVEEDDNSVDCL